MSAAKQKSITVKGKSTTTVANLLDISSKKPIPFEKGSAYSYVGNFKYLPFLGDNDGYGQLLLEARLLSDTHNACIVTKKDYCAGNGFQHKDDTPINKKVSDWFDSMNVLNEPVTEINKQIFENIFTFGNVPIELARIKIGSKKEFFIYPRNFLEWRLGQPNDDGIITQAVHSRLFLRAETAFTDADYKNAWKLPLYNPRNKDSENWIKDKNGVERTMIWYKNSIAGFPYYGLPSAVSALIYQILEYKGARYNLDNFENNMVVSAILALKGNFSQAEADRIGKRVIATHTGDGKKGRVMVVGSEEGIEGSALHSFDTQKDGSYIKSDNIWVQKIILANQWDSVLAGILSPSSFGKGSGFLTKILEIKQNTVIRPAQKDLMLKVWNTIFKLANEWLGLGVDTSNMEIRNAIDISGLTDVDITPAVKVNEVRRAKGLPADASKKGNMYLGELGADQKKGVYVKQTKDKKAGKPPKTSK